MRKQFYDFFSPAIIRLNGKLTIVRRRSSLIWIHRLSCRVNESGQGGDSPISQCELDEAIMSWSFLTLFATQTVLKCVEIWLYRCICLMQYERMYPDHTCVKHKPSNPEFTKKISTRVWKGHIFNNEIRWGGTQKLDGFFAGFKRVVGKRLFNTTSLSDDSRALSLEQFFE